MVHAMQLMTAEQTTVATMRMAISISQRCASWVAWCLRSAAAVPVIVRRLAAKSPWNPMTTGTVRRLKYHRNDRRLSGPHVVVLHGWDRGFWQWNFPLFRLAPQPKRSIKHNSARIVYYGSCDTVHGGRQDLLVRGSRYITHRF